VISSRVVLSDFDEKRQNVEQLDNAIHFCNVRFVFFIIKRCDGMCECNNNLMTNAKRCDGMHECNNSVMTNARKDEEFSEC
jgi:hypothetical protein